MTGSATTATVATGSLAPGAYTVNCGVKEGKPGKEGLEAVGDRHRIGQLYGEAV